MLPMTVVFLCLYVMPVLMFLAIDVVLWNEGVPCIRLSDQREMLRGALIDPMPMVLVAVIVLNVAQCACFAWHWRSITIAFTTLLHLAAIAAVPVVSHLCRIELAL